jgi:putative toxin-antitoxin system antitoxin component (TIGR02293 family)
MDALLDKSNKPTVKRRAKLAAAPLSEAQETTTLVDKTLLYGAAADIFNIPAGLMIAQTRAGFSPKVAVDIAKTLDMSQDKFFMAIGLAKSTIKNRIAQNYPLSPTEGDRMYRVTRVFQRAVEVLEERDAAKEWLQRKNRSLGTVTPLSLLDTEAGYELVLDTLGRIEQGIAA